MPHRPAPRRARRVRKLGAALIATGVLAAPVPAAGIGYAAHLENHDTFCASCHTQPESRYYDLTQAPAVDLASSHAAAHVTCIQCHSGAGLTGRLSAMALVALPDLVAFQRGHYRAPAVVTRPLGDDHCLKCHADVTHRQDFNNHFHVFLATWQARDPGGAATCEDCHVSHVAGGDPRMGYLVEATAVQVCQRCHAFAS